MQAKEMLTLRKLRNDASTFRHFNYAQYVTDVIFQQANRPFGNMAKGKRYSPGKH